MDEDGHGSRGGGFNRGRGGGFRGGFRGGEDRVPKSMDVSFI